MALPLLFTASETGSTLTLTIASDPAYGTDVSNFDVTLGYMTNLASYVSTAPGSGYLVVPGSSGDTVQLSGIASDGGNGQPAGSTLAVLTFTVPSPISDFPLTLTNTALNSDLPASGSADPTVACFVRGTCIRTPNGEVAVELLQADDLVITLDGSLSRVRWVGQRRVACGLHKEPHNVMPVRIHAGALRDGVPSRDLLLSPDHAVFVEGVLIPVRYLLNGATIVQERWSDVTYVHVELERHAVILAEGLPAESYLNTGNKGSFLGESTNISVLPARALAVWASEGCAPLVFEGPVLERARQAFLDRAAELGHATTADHGLHLVADGRTVRGRRVGGAYSFAIPAGARSVRLRSRRFVPAHVVPGSNDYRHLGVAVSAISVDGAHYEPGDGAGWLAPEAGLRWTDGDALIAGAERQVKVSLVALGVYWQADAMAEPLTARVA